MRGYVLRRVAWAVLATFIVLSITFVLLWFTPDAGLLEFQFRAAQAGSDPASAAAAYERIHGLDRPFHEQYRTYMWNMATLDWGWSHYRSEPVIDAVRTAIPYSLMYGVPATVISIVAGLAIGLYSATHQHTKADYAATFVAFFGISIPNFWFAIVLLLLFGVHLGWVPIVFDHRADPLSLANARQLVLPVVVLATAEIAAMMRYSRAEALEYVRADFVKAARAKGVDERGVLLKHILRPASVPLATILVGELLGVIFVASYLIEVVFGIPGLGQLSYNAIVQQDTPLVMATVLVPTFVAIIGNLLQDIAYTILDPRIEFGDR